VIDFDRCRLHIPATPWRESNLARLQRSLRKVLRGNDPSQLDKDFARLRAAYDATWQRGY
jgi:3-deoxy-D-manno-octulosonic acid kinase